MKRQKKYFIAVHTYPNNEALLYKLCRSLRPPAITLFCKTVIAVFLFLSLAGTILAPKNCAWAQDATQEENELFLIAQKAFDDGFYDMAVSYLAQFIEKFSQSKKLTSAKLLLGQCYYFKGQYLKAFDVLQVLQQSNEQKDAVLFWLGETYLKGTDYKQAEKYYRLVIDSYPQSTYLPQAIYSLGWTYFEQKNYARAKESFSEFTKKFPTHELVEDAAFKISECEYNLKNYDAAIASFINYVTSFTQSPRHDQAYFYIGESYFYLENFNEAVKYYNKAADISLDDKIILMSKIGIGWSYLKLTDYAKSQEYFNAADKISQEKNMPLDDIYLGRATLFLETKEYLKAIEIYDQIIGKFSNSPRLAEAYLGRANASYLLGDYQTAINQYELITAKFSQIPELRETIEKANFGLAWTYLKAGNINLSIRSFQNVISQTQNPIVKVSALAQIGDVYQDSNEIEKALETYDKILRDFPDTAYTDYIQYRQGIALLKSNKVEPAINALQHLISNFPKSKYVTEAQYYLGVAYFKKEDWLAAKEQLDIFINQMPKTQELQPTAQYLLGLSILNLGDYKESLNVFQRIAKNYPQEITIIQDSEVAAAKCLYALNDAKEALKKFKIIIYKYPQTEAALESILWLADYYLKTPDLAAATTYFRQAIDDFPQNPRINFIRLQLGQAYQEQGMLNDALNQFKLITDTSDSEVYAKAQLAIADLFSKEANTQSAIETYKKIINTCPEFSRRAHVKIAEIYQAQQDYNNSLNAYKDALKANIGLSRLSDVEIQFLIADMCEILNKTSEAGENYLKIPYLYPQETAWTTKAYLRLARLFEKEEDWENAKSVYQKVIAQGAEESKFAQERVDWITANIKNSKKDILPSTEGRK